MQVCALDEKGQLVHANHAHKQCDYTCLECGRVVRLRKGFHRRAHFYHSQPNQACRLSGKGLVHLSVQYHVLECLPSGEAEMEHRFDSIGRIADVAWISRKIVFEIQCAPISAEEVMARNQNYASLGYDVVWILHTDRYNKTRMTSAEEVLKTHAHYFTDINEEGKGHLYDQYSLIKDWERHLWFPSFAIDISQPFKVQVDVDLPSQFLSRYRNWSYGFAGDYLDSLSKKNEKSHQLHDYFAQLPKQEGTQAKSVLSYLNRWIIYPYQVLLRHFLEKASR